MVRNSLKRVSIINFTNHALITYKYPYCTLQTKILVYDRHSIRQTACNERSRMGDILEKIAGVNILTNLRILGYRV